MTSKKKAAQAAPAAAQPAPTEPSDIAPFGEGESAPGGAGDTATGTEAPQIEKLLPELEEDQPEERRPDVIPERTIDDLPAIPVEMIPRLTFIGPAGIKFYLTPWRPQGTYLLRQVPAS